MSNYILPDGATVDDLCNKIFAQAAEIKRLRAALQAYVDHANESSEMLPCCQAIFDQACAALDHQQKEGEK